jgi:excisionase family DNA binding protein
VLGGLDDMDGAYRTDVKLLRPCDVVEMLGVSRSWLYDAAKSGRIPCVRLGSEDGPVRFRPEEIEEWLEASRARRVLAPIRPVAPADEKSYEPPRRRLARRGGVQPAADGQLGLLPPAADL